MISLASLATRSIVAASASTSVSQLVMLALVVLGIAGAVWWFFIRNKNSGSD